MITLIDENSGTPIHRELLARFNKTKRSLFIHCSKIKQKTTKDGSQHFRSEDVRFIAETFHHGSDAYHKRSY